MNKKNVKMNEKNCIWKDEEYLMFIKLQLIQIQKNIFYLNIILGD